MLVPGGIWIDYLNYNITIADTTLESWYNHLYVFSWFALLSYQIKDVGSCMLPYYNDMLQFPYVYHNEYDETET